MKKIKKAICISALLITLKGFSQSELDPVTVTAGLQQQTISRTGRNITSMKGEAFYHLPVHSLDELLRYLPGIEVQQRGAMGSQSDIVMRGGTFQQVLVILDGIRVNDPITGHFNSYIPIAPNEIERIEILKGASSALYGSDAVGGVIHVMTKAFAAREKKPSRQIQAQGMIGEYGLLTGSIGGVVQTEKNVFSAGIISNNSDGQPQRGTRGYFHNMTGSVSYSRLFSEQWRLSLRSAYDNRDFSAQNFYTTFVSDTASEKVRTFWNQAALQYSGSSNRISFHVGYKNVEDLFRFNSGAAPNDNQSDLWQATGIYEHRLGLASVITGGGQFQTRSIRSNDRGDHGVKQAAGFAILNQTFGDLSLAPALRLDWDERAGAEVIPQLNVSYRKGNLQLRGSAGKTIRQADFTERYNNYNKAFVASGSIGNPDLKAERSFSYEAGADWFLQDFRVSATGFRREQSNVIDWTNTPYADMPRKENLSPIGAYALATNITRVNTSGVEADLFYTKQFGAGQKITGMAGWVWLDSESSQAAPSFYVSSHARFLTNFNLVYSNRYFSIGTSGVYKTREEQKATAISARVDKACFVLNSRADVFVMKNALAVFAQVDNVLNRRGSDLLGSQLPGRWFMGGIKLQAF